PMLMVWRFERHEHVLIAPSGGRADKRAIYRDGFCVYVHVDIFASRDKFHQTAEFLAEPNIKQKIGGIRVLCVQNLDTTTLVLTCAGMLCWAVCFLWMYRISSRQDALLKELRAMTRRIEKLSQSEHDLISEVHPRVNEIKKHVETVREAVSAEK